MVSSIPIEKGSRTLWHPHHSCMARTCVLSRHDVSLAWPATHMRLGTCALVVLQSICPTAAETQFTFLLLYTILVAHTRPLLKAK